MKALSKSVFTRHLSYSNVCFRFEKIMMQSGWIGQQLDPFHLVVLAVLCSCYYWLGISLNRVLWRDWGCGRLGLQCRACSGLQLSSFQLQQTMESLNLQGEEAGAEEELNRDTTISRSFGSANRSRQLACPIAGEEDARLSELDRLQCVVAGNSGARAQSYTPSVSHNLVSGPANSMTPIYPKVSKNENKIVKSTG